MSSGVNFPRCPSGQLLPQNIHSACSTPITCHSGMRSRCLSRRNLSPVVVSDFIDQHPCRTPHAGAADIGDGTPTAKWPGTGLPMPSAGVGPQRPAPGLESCGCVPTPAARRSIRTGAHSAAPRSPHRCGAPTLPRPAPPASATPAAPGTPARHAGNPAPSRPGFPPMLCCSAVLLFCCSADLPQPRSAGPDHPGPHTQGHPAACEKSRPQHPGRALWGRPHGKRFLEDPDGLEARAPGRLMRLNRVMHRGIRAAVGPSGVTVGDGLHRRGRGWVLHGALSATPRAAGAFCYRENWCRLASKVTGGSRLPVGHAPRRGVAAGFRNVSSLRHPTSAVKRAGCHFFALGHHARDKAMVRQPRKTPVSRREIAVLGTRNTREEIVCVTLSALHPEHQRAGCLCGSVVEKCSSRGHSWPRLCPSEPRALPGRARGFAPSLHRGRSGFSRSTHPRGTRFS